MKRVNPRAWISNTSYENTTGYIVYPNCPYDYCHSGPNVQVNLNQNDGADAQCAFDRSKLLGSCKPYLSLSLGSSQCILCPNYWPAIFVTITIAAAIAGVALQ